MGNSSSIHRTLATSLAAVLAISAGGVIQASAQAPQDVGRPMSFLDVQQFSSPGSWTPSPDGRWMRSSGNVHVTEFDRTASR